MRAGGIGIMKTRRIRREEKESLGQRASQRSWWTAESWPGRGAFVKGSEQDAAVVRWMRAEVRCADVSSYPKLFLARRGCGDFSRQHFLR